MRGGVREELGSQLAVVRAELREESARREAALQLEKGEQNTSNIKGILKEEQRHELMEVSEIIHHRSK